jgi:type I site-specific restriction endonuclease
MTSDDYIGPEAAARITVDGMLSASGRRVQDFNQIALDAALGVAVRGYPMAKGRRTTDYPLFIDGSPDGVVEAKKDGTSLVEVEWQSKYSEACQKITTLGSQLVELCSLSIAPKHFVIGSIGAPSIERRQIGEPS